MKVLVAHPGTQLAPRISRELHRCDSLAALHTGFVFSGKEEVIWPRFLPRSLRRQITNRRVKELPPDKISTYPALELIAWLRIHSGADQQRVMHWRNGAFQRRIPDSHLIAADFVLGFDTSSWILADRCRKLNVPFGLNQTTPHPQTKVHAFEALKGQFPDWAASVEERHSYVLAAEHEEYRLADIIHVANSFTKASLVNNGVPESKLWLNTYGADCTTFQPREDRREHPLRFVFVGAVTGTKGVPLLLEAWKALQPVNAELWLVGKIGKRIERLIPSLNGLQILGAVAHQRLPEILRACDVFILPSYYEGFAIVILEAMASGLPVITTTATAGPDIITEGREGWIFDPGDLDALIEKMRLCLKDVNAVRLMRAAARTTAEQHSWSRYTSRLISNFETVSSQRKAKGLAYR